MRIPPFVEVNESKKEVSEQFTLGSGVKGDPQLPFKATVSPIGQIYVTFRGTASEAESLKKGGMKPYAEEMIDSLEKSTGSRWKLGRHEVKGDDFEFVLYAAGSDLSDVILSVIERAGRG